MNVKKEIVVAKAPQVFVNAKSLTLSLSTKQGKDVLLKIPAGLDRDILSLMSSALLRREEGTLDQEAGAALVDAEIQPIRVEQVQENHKLLEKFVLQLSSEGATEVTFRLSEQSVRDWITKAEVQMAEKRKKNRLSS